MVWEWTKERGLVSRWSGILANEFDDATRNGTINELAQEWRAHADVGNVIVKDLNSVVCSKLPGEDSDLRDLLRQAFDLLSSVLAGIVAIQAVLTTLDI
jgi:hypothetical protein